MFRSAVLPILHVEILRPKEMNYPVTKPGGILNCFSDSTAVLVPSVELILWFSSCPPSASLLGPLMLSILRTMDFFIRKWSG